VLFLQLLLFEFSANLLPNIFATVINRAFHKAGIHFPEALFMPEGSIIHKSHHKVAFPQFGILAARFRNCQEQIFMQIIPI